MVKSQLQKHTDSIRSAEILHSEKMNANSIHCSYYSVYQLILHVISEESIPVPGSHSAGWEGSHQRTINAIHEEITERKRINGFRWKNDIEKLKTHRKKADYEIAFFDSSFSSTCIDFAKGLISGLKTTFEIQ